MISKRAGLANFIAAVKRLAFLIRVWDSPSVTPVTEPGCPDKIYVFYKAF
jgi:hypothetical protein